MGNREVASQRQSSYEADSERVIAPHEPGEKEVASPLTRSGYEVVFALALV